MTRSIEVNKPNHVAHGMPGYVVTCEGSSYVVDVDGVEMRLGADEILFIKYRKAPMTRARKLGIWLERFVIFVIAFGIGIVYGRVSW